MNEPTKLPPLRPVITEREKVLSIELMSIIKRCEMCIRHDESLDASEILEQAQRALNFKYGDE